MLNLRVFRRRMIIVTVQTKSQSPFKGLRFSAFNYCLFICLAAKKIKGKKEILQIFRVCSTNFMVKEIKTWKYRSFMLFYISRIWAINQLVNLVHYRYLGYVVNELSRVVTCSSSKFCSSFKVCKRAESSSLSPIMSRARVAWFRYTPLYMFKGFWKYVWAWMSFFLNTSRFIALIGLVRKLRSHWW